MRTAIESNSPAGKILSHTQEKNCSEYPTKNILASVPNPIFSLPSKMTKTNMIVLSSACQFPIPIPIFSEIARFMLVQGSVPRSTSTSNDSANPITITDRITAVSLTPKFFF